jgi:hypothetical protein
MFLFLIAPVGVISMLVSGLEQDESPETLRNVSDNELRMQVNLEDARDHSRRRRRQPRHEPVLLGDEGFCSSSH